ncbi:unnamed protein product [Anisakis simplex]|uniref:Uncharacterized protein n=1 Tax=Anisakis simplex TaxID=6269 RepID=A0A3P6Q7Y2_ANISI|nr:unnamed protein product [Anisakis simplex]
MENVNWKTHSNVLEGDYQSVMPFKEVIWREQMIDLESQLNEQAERLQQIRLNYDAEFTAKFNEHLKSCLEAKHMTQLTAPSVTLSSPIESRAQPQFLVPSALQTSSFVSRTSFISHAADDFNEPAKSYIVNHSLLSQPPVSSSPDRNAQQNTSSQSFFSFKQLSSTPKHDSSVTTQQHSQHQKMFSGECQQSHLIGNYQNVPKSVLFSSLQQQRVQPQQFNESATLCDQSMNRSSQMIKNDTILSSTVNYETSPIVFESTHPALSRTDSGAASTSDALPAASHSTPFVHEQCITEFIDTTEVSRKDSLASPSVENTMNEERIISEQINQVEVLDGKSSSMELPSTSLNRPSIFENWFELTKQFEASIQDFNKSSNNDLRSDLKYTIKERTAVWTKKYATEDEIQRAARFFIDLLSGITVFGFKDKRINLKGEGLAQQWAIAYIIQAYINLVIQDSSLVDVVAAILSRIASNCESFKSFLSAKLCTSSAEKVVELSQQSANASEATSAWGNRENTLIRLFAAVHSAACLEHAGPQLNEESGTRNGVPLLWMITAIALKQSSSLAVALIASLLTQSGWLLREVYKKQFDKILAVIGEKLIPQWDRTLKNSSHDVVNSFQRMWLATLKDSYERGQFLKKRDI